MPNLTPIDRFKKLVDDISVLYVNARAAQVKFAWETGQRIVTEEQDGQLRAKYGTRLIRELSAALTKKHGVGFSKTNLERMRQFYVLHPIAPAPGQLNWTDHVELLPVKDGKLRRRLQARAVKEGLNSRQLRRLVREEKFKASGTVPVGPVGPVGPKGAGPVALKRPADLKLNTYASSGVNSPDLQKGEVMVDCGFFVHRPVAKEQLKNVTLTDKPSYTYEAEVERVVDGDTLVVLIRSGFRNIVRERLRLRGVNTPELGTPEGERARKFVMKLLPGGTLIVLKSHKCQTDPYGRFVADVFYNEKEKGAVPEGTVPLDMVYLNQRLLDEGLAARMEM